MSANPFAIVPKCARQNSMQDFEIDKLADAATGSYRDQGDFTMYSNDKIAKRINIKDSPRAKEEIDRFWNCFASVQEHGEISVDEYTSVSIRLSKALFHESEFTVEEGQLAAADDWNCEVLERGRATMDKETYFESLFELTDLWTESVHPDEYVGFLVSIYLSHLFFFRKS